MSLSDFFINKAISSGFLKSRIQALARTVAMAGGTYLVQHGLANQEISTALVGAVVGVVAMYLQDLDVKIVDGKIKVALNTQPSQTTPVYDVNDVPPTDPIIPVTVKELPPISNSGKSGHN